MAKKRKSDSWVLGSADWLQYPEIGISGQENVNRAYERKANEYLRQMDAQRSKLMTQNQYFNYGYPGNRSDTAGYMKFQDYMRPAGTESGEAGKAQLAQNVMEKSEALKQDWQSSPEQVAQQQSQLARISQKRGMADLFSPQQQEQLLYGLQQYQPLLERLRRRR